MKNKKQKKIRYTKSAFNEDMTKENDLKTWRMNFNKRLNKKFKETVVSNKRENTVKMQLPKLT